ncbi:MAG: hypothetical protein P8Z80_00275 [Pseudolabrys sp.]
MGYAVRTKDGHAHVIVLDSDIGNSKNDAALRYLIERNTTRRSWCAAPRPRREASRWAAAVSSIDCPDRCETTANRPRS